MELEMSPSGSLSPNKELESWLSVGMNIPINEFLCPRLISLVSCFKLLMVVI
jgi:hypothetical protein